MKIIVAGTGYVGLVHAAVCSDYGHEVYAYGIDAEKIKAFSTGQTEEIEKYVNEPGLTNIIKETLGKYLFFTSDLNSILEGTDAIFMCLPTPPNLDGSTNLTFYNAAAENDRRYAVVLDFTEQSFVLRECKSLDLETMDTDEAIIQTTYFSEALTLDYVLYDDLDDTRDYENMTQARFLAGHSGWQNGGKVVLLDEDGMPWTILIHRFAKPVELFKGDGDIGLPQAAEDGPL